MNRVRVACANCGQFFRKPVGEYNRSERLGKSHCCTKSCATSLGNKVSPRGTTAHMRDYEHRDRFTPFRALFNTTKRHAAGKKGHQSAKDFLITHEDMLEQWERQNGVCPYTGWKLHLPINSTRAWDDSADPLKRASLDRIDSAIGYVRGNIQFVAQMANYAKNRFSDGQLLLFCEAVVDHLSTLVER